MIKKYIVRSIILIITFCYLATHGGEVAIAGSVIGSAFRIFDDIGDNADHVDPAIAFNYQDGEYLVVWSNDRPGNDDIYGQRISKLGVPVGSWFAIAYGPLHERRTPDVAYNSKLNEYLVVWDEPDQGIAYAQRVSAIGQLIDGPILITICQLLGDCAKSAVAYSSDSDTYLVIIANSNTPLLWQILSSTGQPIEGDTFDIYFSLNPDLVYNPSRNEFLAVYETLKQVSGNWTTNVYATRFQGNGKPINPLGFEIGIHSADQTNPSVTVIPTTPNDGQYLIVWEHHYSPTDRDIHGLRLTGEGNPIGTRFTISGAATDESSPAVAGSEVSDQYLVAWKEAVNPTSVIVMHEFSLVGNFLDGMITSAGADQNHPVVASGPAGDFLIAFDASAIDTGIYGQLWGNRQFLPITIRNH